ncbi:MAG: hypothetical protein NTZ25_02645 [Candidatus Peregrinibacteria bacterium]|nr:hypothetical protein [Candidatus Peregrinibacteria bacterium]
MEKTTLRSLFLLTIITGSLFTFIACGPEVKEVETKETTKVETTDKAGVPTKEPVKDLAPKTDVNPKDTNVTKPVETPKAVITKPEVKVTTKYVDGTYTKVGSYQSPGGTDAITVSVTLKNDVMESVSLVNGATSEASVNFQNLFIDGVKGQVVGQKLENVSVGVVNGASLTGAGFNQAIADIKTAAQR